MRNSLEQNDSLFEETVCKCFFYMSRFEELASNVEGAGPENIHDSFVRGMIEASPRPYKYKRIWEEVANDPIFCHTSRSTGNPQPLKYINQFIGHLATHRYVQAPPGQTTNN
jgi:hypothetical protein